MDHRFSTLFFSAPPAMTSTDTTMSGALPDLKAAGKKHKSVKGIIRRMLGIQSSKERDDSLVKERIVESRPSELSQQVWRSFGSSSTIIVQPSITTPSRKKVVSTSITNKKRSDTTSTRDSKFSSISSLPSLAALSFHTHSHTSSPHPSGPIISLSVQELATLQSLIRRVERQLKKQEYLTNHLAGNLVHLFGRKEMQIQCLKRCRVQDREVAAREILKMKENVGRGFLRRGVLVGRCEGALNLLRIALDSATRAPSTRSINRRRSSSPSHPSNSNSSSRTSLPSSYTTATSSISSKSTSIPPLNPTFTLSLSALSDTIYTLTSSLSLHTVLNADLRSQIHSTCARSRWNGLPGGGVGWNGKGNVNDRIMMLRFVSFVDSRLVLLEECGGRLEGLVGMMEGFGKREGRD